MKDKKNKNIPLYGIIDLSRDVEVIQLILSKFIIII